MNTGYYKKYEPLFNSWYIVKLIGQGSYGQVYEIERKELGVTYKAALKTITIPQNQGEVKSLLAEGMSKEEVTEYYREIVQTIVNEFILMSKLKGNSNIVSYEDHMLVEHDDGIGWDILIRMELLTPLFDFLAQKSVTRRDVIKLGIDMCKALELCQKYNIVHRDVKPENIFVSPSGSFKLGDFGIAKIIEKTGNDMSRKGTYTYMAPEVYRGETYDSTVDIYSLGIVMYRLLNENRTPFLPGYPQTITFADKENALIKRISGVKIPEPKNASGRLKEIVLKACAHNPKERYGAPLQMRMELEAILYGKDEATIIYPMGDEAPIKSLKYATSNSTKSDIERTESITEVNADFPFGNLQCELDLNHTSSLTGVEPKQEFICSTDQKIKNNFLQDDKTNDHTMGLDGNSDNLDVELTLGLSPEMSEIDKKTKPKIEKNKNKLVMFSCFIMLFFIIVMVSTFTAEPEINIENPLIVYNNEPCELSYNLRAPGFSESDVEIEVKDPDIFEILEDGTYIPKKFGKTQLTFKIGDEYSKTIDVYSLISDTITLAEGSYHDLCYDFDPKYFGSSQSVYYKVDDEMTAFIEEDGRLYGNNEGNTFLSMLCEGETICNIEVNVTRNVDDGDIFENQLYCIRFSNIVNVVENGKIVVNDAFKNSYTVEQLAERVVSDQPSCGFTPMYAVRIKDNFYVAYPNAFENEKFLISSNGYTEIRKMGEGQISAKYNGKIYKMKIRGELTSEGAFCIEPEYKESVAFDYEKPLKDQVKKDKNGNVVFYWFTPMDGIEGIKLEATFVDGDTNEVSTLSKIDVQGIDVKYEKTVKEKQGRFHMWKITISKYYSASNNPTHPDCKIWLHEKGNLSDYESWEYNYRWDMDLRNFI